MRELISFQRAIKIQLVIRLLHQIQFYHALSFTLYANAASNTRVYNNTTWIQWCTIQLLVVGWSFNDGSIFRVTNKYLEIYHNKMSQTTSPRLFFTVNCISGISGNRTLKTLREICVSCRFSSVKVSLWTTNNHL